MDKSYYNFSYILGKMTWYCCTLGSFNVYCLEIFLHILYFFIWYSLINNVLKQANTISLLSFSTNGYLDIIKVDQGVQNPFQAITNLLHCAIICIYSTNSAKALSIDLKIFLCL